MPPSNKPIPPVSPPAAPPPPAEPPAEAVPPLGAFPPDLYHPAGVNDPATWELATDIGRRMAAGGDGDPPAEPDHAVVYLDPTVIVMIIGVLAELVKLYRDCRKTPAEAMRHYRNAGPARRLLLRIQLRAAFHRRVSDPDARALFGDRPVGAILAVGERLDEKQVAHLFKVFG